MVVALGAQTVDRARTEAETRRVDNRVRALQNEADSLAGQARTLLGDLRTLEIDRALQIGGGRGGARGPGHPATWKSASTAVPSIP